MSNKKDLKAFVRYDGNGRVVSGSLVLRKKMPKVGRWQEIVSNECCNFSSEINFDITADWLSVGVTDKASFKAFLNGGEDNDGNVNYFHNIIIRDFTIVSVDESLQQITCYLKAESLSGEDYSLGLEEMFVEGDISKIGDLSKIQTIYLYDNNIVTFNPSIALPSGLQELGLGNNSIVTFNPSIALPDSINDLDLANNPMTTAGYTASEPWANAMSVIPGRGSINFSNNVDSITGTNLETILVAKGWTILDF